MSGALTLPAGPVDREEALLQANLSGALAAATLLDGISRFGSRAFAGIAAFPSRNFELGFFALYRFFKGQFQIILQVIALLRATSTSSPASEEVFKNIAENVAESSTEIKTFGSAESLRTRRMPERIVPLSRFRIAQDFIRFIGFLEFFFGLFFVLRVTLQVGVVLTGEPPEGLLDLVLRGISIHSEDFIIVSFGHARHLFRSMGFSALFLLSRRISGKRSDDIITSPYQLLQIRHRPLFRLLLFRRSIRRWNLRRLRCCFRRRFQPTFFCTFLPRVCVKRS